MGRRLLIADNNCENYSNEIIYLKANLPMALLLGQPRWACDNNSAGDSRRRSHRRGQHRRLSTSGGLLC